VRSSGSATNGSNSSSSTSQGRSATGFAPAWPQQVRELQERVTEFDRLLAGPFRATRALVELLVEKIVLGREEFTSRARTPREWQGAGRGGMVTRVQIPGAHRVLLAGRRLGVALADHCEALLPQAAQARHASAWSPLRAWDELSGESGTEHAPAAPARRLNVFRRALLELDASRQQTASGRCRVNSGQPEQLRGRRVELEPESAEHLDDGVEVGATVPRERLVQALS
jgi:hypothetical protein